VWRFAAANVARSALSAIVKKLTPRWFVVKGAFAFALAPPSFAPRLARRDSPPAPRLGSR